MKYFIYFFIFFHFLSTALYPENLSKNKYEIFLNMCKSMQDKPCELKYYSYLYDLADEMKKYEIIKEVNMLLDGITPMEYNNIDFKKFKKNYIYIISKLSRLQFEQDENFIKEVLSEAEDLLIYNKVYNYLKTKYNYSYNIEKLDRDISIVLLFPLSGRFKKIGEKCLEGALTAVDFFNSKTKVTFYVVDSSLNNFSEKLEDILKMNQIDVVVGPIRRAIEQETVQIAINYNVPIISLVTNSNIRVTYRYYFNHSLNIYDEMEQLAEIIKEDNVNLGIMYPESPFGNRFKYNLIKHNVSPIVAVSYPPDTVDFKNQIIMLGNLKRESPKNQTYIQRNSVNAIFIADDIEKALVIIPQLYFFDLKNIKIYGTNLWNSKKLFNLDKKFQKNITFLDLINYNSKEENFVIFKNYLKKYFSDEPHFYNIFLFDTLKLIIKSSFANKDDLRYFLMNNNFFLLTGKTFFDNNGISHKRFKVFHLINGKLNTE